MNKTNQEGIISRMMRLYGCTKDAELAERLGVVKATISRYRKGKIRLSLAAVLKAAQETDTALDWLLTGKPSAPAPVLNIQTGAEPETFHQDFSADNYLPVRLLRDEIAAGMPSEIRDSDIDGHCLIYADKAWMPGNPENYTCCRVRGDSMYPILADGDIVAIDHSLKDPKALHKKMVAFRYSGGAAVKWLSYIKKGTVLGIPENKNSMEATICLVGEEIETGIIGKVAWWWAKR
jgi:phage repressor protein C with HTH and peptisase S24 domain